MKYTHDRQNCPERHGLVAPVVYPGTRDSILFDGYVVLGRRLFQRYVFLGLILAGSTVEWFRFTFEVRAQHGIERVDAQFNVGAWHCVYLCDAGHHAGSYDIVREVALSALDAPFRGVKV